MDFNNILCSASFNNEQFEEKVMTLGLPVASNDACRTTDGSNYHGYDTLSAPNIWGCGVLAGNVALDKQWYRETVSPSWMPSCQHCDSTSSP